MNYEPYLNTEAAPGPLYLALYGAIVADLKSGKLRKGERMPSIRAMARRLDLSITPVESAYQQLCAEGYLIAKAKSGYVVADMPEMQPLDTGSGKAPETHTQPLDDFTRTSVYLYDFHIARNDFSFFPFPIWRRLMNTVMKEDGNALLFYGDRQGEWGLRTELTSYLMRCRGVICEPEQVVIGAEQHLLLHYLTLMLKDKTRILAAENPCYPLIPQAFRSAGYSVVPLDISGSGIASLSDNGSQSGASPSGANPGIAAEGPLQLTAGIISVAPSHQFPSGRVMSAAEKLRLLEWSTRTGGCIIEDDYGGELRYRGQPIPALQGLAPDANVIYLGGMPQVLAPELCIHYMVLPKGMLPAFRKLGQQLMFEPSSPRIYQRAMEHFIRDGHFERHIRRMRNVYRRKMNLLKESLGHSFGEKCVVDPAVTGLHLVLTVVSRYSEETLTEAAKQAGIRIASASPYTTGRQENGPKRELLIGFGGIPEEQIEAGASALAQVLIPLLRSCYSI